MIIGIGNDIIETERISNALKHDGFLEKYFTSNEIILFEGRKMNPATIGGNYSVKEAVSKALGTGLRDFGLKDIEVLRDDLGKPFIRLTGNAQILADDLDIDMWHVSISHDRTHITAMAIGEKR